MNQLLPTILVGWYVGMSQSKMATVINVLHVKWLKLCCTWVTRKKEVARQHMEVCPLLSKPFMTIVSVLGS